MKRGPSRTDPSSRFFAAVGPGGAFPSSPRVEVVFCGRSNVGKSSLLNALTGVRGLARTSKTPGRTREIHFYEHGVRFFLVDLPGYGFAKVATSARRSWGALVEAYLERTNRIALAILLVDARHPAFESDRALAASLASRGIPFLVALTKSDKLGVQARLKALRANQGLFKAAAGCILTSAWTGAGIPDLARAMDGTAVSEQAGEVAAEGSSRAGFHNR